MGDDADGLLYPSVSNEDVPSGARGASGIKFVKGTAREARNVVILYFGGLCAAIPGIFRSTEYGLQARRTSLIELKRQSRVTRF